MHEIFDENAQKCYMLVPRLLYRYSSCSRTITSRVRNRNNESVVVVEASSEDKVH